MGMFVKKMQYSQDITILVDAIQSKNPPYQAQYENYRKWHQSGNIGKVFAHLVYDADPEFALTFFKDVLMRLRKHHFGRLDGPPGRESVTEGLREGGETPSFFFRFLATAEIKEGY